MGFAKLVDGIIHSSIWSEPLATRVLWITLLAMKDENGFVAASRTGLIRAANITPEEFDRGILALGSPDPDSRTPDHEGRRIARISGGWVILNHELYKLDESKKREQTRERVRRFRAKKRNETLGNVTPALPSVSVSASISGSDQEKEGIIKGGKGYSEEDLLRIATVIRKLNAICHTSFRDTSKATRKHIHARIQEGFHLKDFVSVIEFKNEEWGEDPKMCQYLRPETLFGTKFESYLQAARKSSDDDTPSVRFE